MTKRLIFLGSGTISDEIRMELYVPELNERGYSAHFFQPNQFDRVTANAGDIFIMNRPGVVSAKLASNIVNSGKKLIIDMDDCYHEIPPHHVAFNSIGAGNPTSLKATEDTIRAANLLTTSTKRLGDYYAYLNANQCVIPNGWSKRMLNWRKHVQHSGITVGWTGTITHRVDFKYPSIGIIKYIKRYANTRIMIGSDQAIINMFSMLDRKQAWFFPFVPYEIYSMLLGYFDILVVPLQKDTFNSYKSDIKLVECGVKGIPFVASNIDFYQDWGVGGLFVENNNSNEWYEALVKLHKDGDLQARLSYEGEIRARDREVGILVAHWIDAIEAL